MSHKLAEPYSGKNPVPKITTKLTSLVNPEKATAAKAQQVQDRSGQHAEQETAQTAKRLAKGHVMRTTDPTTGEELTIRNADPKMEAEWEEEGGENVLAHAFPPPDIEMHRKVVLSSTSTAFLYSSAGYTCALLLALLFGSHPWLWPIILLPPTFLAYTMHFRMKNTSQGDFQDRIWHSERVRGLRAGDDLDGDGNITTEEHTKESAEWVNSVLRGVWPIVNPDMFSSLVDMLEDIMQSSAPSFVHSIRIADLGLGRNAARITSIRSLPDAGDSKNGDEISKSLEVDSEDMSPEDRDALGGDHVNLEVGFAYRAEPSGESAQSKAKNIHLLVEFFIGLTGVFGVKFPVWVEVTGAIGTARARLQLISTPPFVKTTMITLLGLPHVTISVVPLSERLPNVMNVPFLSGFISSAINTAAAEYVAPKSLTLDLQKLINGDDIKKDTEALGVLVVHIHRATGLAKADTNGASDPYITLTFSRLGKPLYSTRIIKGDLNPVFEETAFVLVDVNTAKLREKLSFQLWDSDRMSVDDMLGYHEIDVVELIRQRAKPIRRVSPLSSPDSRHRPGNVEYTVGYYGKLPPNSALSTDGTDPGIPDDLRQKPEFKEARAVSLNDLEAAVLTTPPDEEWVSGILSVQVHEIRGLTVRRGETSGTENKGQDDSNEPREEGEGLPSSYCTISLNDELVYETRVKPITSSPMFNAGMERFIRDRRKSHVTVTVKDSRMRENDPVLGIVLLKLSELLVNASEVTRFWSIEQGIGYGRIRISVLFRPVEAKLPPNLLGFETGTLEIHNIAVQSKDDLSYCEVHMKVTTTAAEQKVSRKKAEKRDDQVVWSEPDSSKLPVRQRYGAALLVSIRDASVFKASGRKALGVLWLRDLVDNNDGRVEIALWQAKHGDYSRLKLNYVPPDGDLSYWDTDKENVERIGSLFLDMCFKPGISGLHHQLLTGGGAKKREAWDQYDRQKAGHMRDGVGKMGVKTTPGDHQSQENNETSRADGRVAGTPEDDKTASGGPINEAGGDTSPLGVGDESRTEGANTVVSTDAVETEEQVLEHPEEHEGASDEVGESGRGSEDGGRKGPIAKLKDWRQHERELHRGHRGVMQAKPARTAQWMKDNVEEGVHAVKERMKMHSREPDVETEA
ncbi:uncharacterized protein C8Q71DRAFT_785114 [Rhodofomes roseus]|uniref:C2 domain-containing protein n=1 Tax=Rhodofomes roseus TaxID=34475 RepID=A0ABQ8K1L0_9APHY|nr:uncharacterized protein C8Q71DRAFT_785114 [Rhodofomes roseus]KAH9830601.1 hypothetical protein C8Q71DRAFT_785114 [Rhodofomes roseus]